MAYGQQAPDDRPFGFLSNWPVVGDIYNGLTGGDPAQQALQQQYAQNRALMQNYRPRALQAREMGLAHNLQALGPANEMIKRMYGQEFGLDLNALGQPGIAAYLGDPSVFQGAAAQGGQGGGGGGAPGAALQALGAGTVGAPEALFAGSGGWNDTRNAILQQLGYA